MKEKNALIRLTQQPRQGSKELYYSFILEDMKQITNGNDELCRGILTKNGYNLLSSLDEYYRKKS